MDTAVLAASFCRNAPRHWSGSAPMGLATRKPMLLFSFVGLLLLRFEERKLFSVLFQLPPRIARFSDVFYSGAPSGKLSGKNRPAQAPTLGVFSVRIGSHEKTPGGEERANRNWNDGSMKETPEGWS
jgi:hypothetical protein